MATKNNHGDLRIWWMPQVGANAPIFYSPVKDVREAATIFKMLAEYDQFQFANGIKPDYTNMGGLHFYSQDAFADGDDPWMEWENEDGYSIGDVYEDILALHEDAAP